MRTRAALAVLALSCAGAAQAADTWVEVKSPNFVVVSNSGEGRARQTAWEFEQVRVAYEKLWPWARLKLDRPAVVVAVKDDGTLRRWAPKYWEVKGGIDIVSVTAHGADREFLLLRTDSRPDNEAVTPNYNLYRAYLQSLLSASLDRPLPAWLSNGLSDVYGNTSVHEKEVRVGRPVPWEFKYFSDHARLPLREVLAAEYGSALLTRELDRRIFDAQCYVLVHYLAYSDRGAQAPKLNKFVQLWLSGRPQEEALRESLGDITDLEQRLPQYATSAVLLYGRVPVDVNLDRQGLPARTVGAAELLGLQAAVHVAMNRPADARAAIREARAADPTAPASYDAEGLLADLEDATEPAGKAYARACELGSTSPYSYYRSARLSWKQDQDAETVATVRARLEQLLKLNEGFARAHSFLAEILVQQQQAQLALEHAQRAVALEPANAYHQLALGRVLDALDQKDAARTAGERSLRLAKTAAERGNAERFLKFIGEREVAKAQQAASAACTAGDPAACARLMPDLERWCGESNAGACSFAAYLLSQGKGVPKDLAQAASFYERGCQAGDKRSCVERAWAQARGEGLAKDETKAKATLDTLCNENTLAACTRLAVLHGSKPAASAADRAKAKALLARACTGGEQDACRMASQLK